MTWVKALILVLAGACSGDVTHGSTDGAKLFESMCASCHGPNGQPPAAMVARLGVKDLTARELRARVSIALVEQQVRSGSKNKLMPSFRGVLSDAQITAVAAHVASPAFQGTNPTDGLPSSIR